MKVTFVDTRVVKKKKKTELSVDHQKLNKNKLFIFLRTFLHSRKGHFSEVTKFVRYLVGNVKSEFALVVTGRQYKISLWCWKHAANVNVDVHTSHVQLASQRSTTHYILLDSELLDRGCRNAQNICVYTWFCVSWWSFPSASERDLR